jgi:hypothetical protein
MIILKSLKHENLEKKSILKQLYLGSKNVSNVAANFCFRSELFKSFFLLDVKKAKKNSRCQKIHVKLWLGGQFPMH